MADRRRALLLPALAAVRVSAHEPELVIVHALLDSWRGLGLVAVGMARHGYDLWLTSDENGWRATFLHRSHLMQPWVGQVLTWWPTPLAGTGTACRTASARLAARDAACPATVSATQRTLPLDGRARRTELDR